MRVGVRVGVRVGSGVVSRPFPAFLLHRPPKEEYPDKPFRIRVRVQGSRFKVRFKVCKGFRGEGLRIKG